MLNLILMLDVGCFIVLCWLFYFQYGEYILNRISQFLLKDFFMLHLYDFKKVIDYFVGKFNDYTVRSKML